MKLCHVKFMVNFCNMRKIINCCLEIIFLNIMSLFQILNTGIVTEMSILFITDKLLKEHDDFNLPGGTVGLAISKSTVPDSQSLILNLTKSISQMLASGEHKYSESKFSSLYNYFGISSFLLFFVDIIVFYVIKSQQTLTIYHST